MSMRLPATMLALLALAGPAAGQERVYPDLYCTDRSGDRIELGGLTCIAAGCVPAYLARCEMSLNSPMWRKLQEGCPAVARKPGPSAVPRASARSAPG